MKTNHLVRLLAGITFVALSPATWAAGHGGGGDFGGGGGFHGGGFRGGGFRGFHDRGFGRRFAFGFYPYDYYDDYPYGYYPYDSSDLYADNGNCYVVQRRVHTKHGWRLQPRQVCG